MDYRQLVLDHINRIYKAGLTTTSGGNLSVRDEEGNIYITPSGKDKGTLELNDICKVTPSGEQIGPYKPSIELPFHSLIYKLRPDIRAVVHVHSPYLVSYSLLNRAPENKSLWQYYETSPSVGLSLYDIPGSIELGRQIAKYIEQGYDSVMMQNHGVVCVAPSMEEAFYKLDNLERCAKTCLKANRLGGVKTIDDNMLDKYVSYSESIPCERGVDNYAELRNQICAFARRSYEHGYFGTVSGTISARVEGGILITPREYDREYLKPQDIVYVKDGVAYGGEPDKFWALHAKIYAKHPEIGSVYCATPTSIMAYAVSGAEIDSRTLPESYIMMRNILRLPVGSDIFDQDKVADILCDAAPVVMVDGSQVITTGVNITKAFDRMEVSDVTATNYLLAGTLGVLNNITDEEIDKIDKYFGLPKLVK